MEKIFRLSIVDESGKQQFWYCGPELELDMSYGKAVVKNVNVGDLFYDRLKILQIGTNEELSIKKEIENKKPKIYRTTEDMIHSILSKKIKGL